MKINSDLLIDSSVNGTFYANDFKCKNMYGYIITGIIMNNSGVETANSNWQSTPYIKVNSLTNYYYSYSTNNPQSVMGLVTEYNSSKAFIKQTVINANTHSIETTSNTKYVRLSNRIDINMTNIQFELGSTATEYTPYKAFENDETLKDTQTFSNEGISWGKAITYETATDVPSWYELITLTLTPKKTGVYLINYSIPVLAKAGGTPFLDFNLDGTRKHRAYISNVSSYASMNAMAITGSFTLSGISLNQNHSLVIGVSKNNSVGYKVNAGYPITVTAMEI